MHQHLYRKKSGGVAVALLLISFTVIALIGGYLSYSMQGARLTHRAMAYQRCMMVADMVLESVRVQLDDPEVSRAIYSTNALQTVLNDRNIIKKLPDFESGTYTTMVFKATALGYGNQLEGDRLVSYHDVEVIVGVSNTVTGVRAAVRERVRLQAEPFLRYAIFYDQTLTAAPGPLMEINGDVRSNEDMRWESTGSDLVFKGDVICAGDFNIDWQRNGPAPDASRMNYASHTKIELDDGVGGTYLEDFIYDGKVLDSSHPEWKTLSESVLQGKVRDRAQKVPELNPALGVDDYHLLIEPPDGSDSAAVAREKLANKADLVITLVEGSSKYKVTHNGSVEWFDLATPGAKVGTNGHYSVASGDFVGVSTTFGDYREVDQGRWWATGGKPSALGSPQQMCVADVYIDRLLDHYEDDDIGIVYVDMPADMGTSSGMKPAVRIRNASDLSDAADEGFTFSTERTLYVEGDYNNKSDKLSLLVADNITLLSKAWDDSNSNNNLPPAASTALYAALMTGYGDINKRHNGGANNLIRLREDWSFQDYWFKGSLMSMWVADSLCLYRWAWPYTDNTYLPPNRHIEYDRRFLSGAPPGMPIGYAEPFSVVWEPISWGEATN